MFGPHAVVVRGGPGVEGEIRLKADATKDQLVEVFQYRSDFSVVHTHRQDFISLTWRVFMECPEVRVHIFPEYFAGMSTLVIGFLSLCVNSAQVPNLVVQLVNISTSPVW